MPKRLSVVSRKKASRASVADPNLYFNRELSLLEFNRRVLEQAKDTSVPLLERLRFLTITTSNLDEFFEIRVAGIMKQIEAGLSETGPDGLTPQEALSRVRKVAHELVVDQYRTLNDVLLPALRAEGIRVLRRTEWDEKQNAWVEDYFRREVQPVLTPVGLDPAHPFPKILNKALNFMVSLEGEDAFGRSSGMAVVQAPRILPRLIRMPKEIAGGPNDFILLTSVIHAHVEEVFPGMRVLGCHQFRVTRNSDLWVDEEEIDDLLRALKGELVRRNFGDEIRLEVTTNCDAANIEFLRQQFQLAAEDIFVVDGPVNLNRLSALYDLADRPDLKYSALIPAPLPSGYDGDLFGLIRQGDVLLHHPYQSFAPVVDLVRQAAKDPNVLAIKQTLYRTGKDSPLTEALLEAAAAGKEVTAVIELRARFDEAANIDLATRFQDLGAKVAYGVVGYKTHAKMLLIVRREGAKLRRYVHLATGNYHIGTSRAYTDFGLFTCDEAIGEDVHNLFLQLTGLGSVTTLRKLLQSPFTLHKGMIERIDAEAEAARQGKPARITAKMNALIEPEMIQALYRASQAGVKVELIVRGMCSLRAGVPGLSDNIHVRSIVGRFLEHSRIFRFHAGGEDVTYLSSADWMQRNMFGRVEVAFPIENRELRDRVWREGLEAYLADDSQAWVLQPDGRYRRVEKKSDSSCRAQEVLLREVSAPRRTTA